MIMSAEEWKEKIIGLEGVVVNFRLGNKTINQRQVILRFDNLPEGLKVDNLIGCVVEIRWRNKTFKGRIYKKHGINAVRAIFKKGLPGQILGNSKAVIIK